MITDPKTIPASQNGRRVYAVGVGLLATLLIAPQTTEFATKVAILAALFVVCATRGVIELVGASRLAASLPPPRPGESRSRRRAVGRSSTPGSSSQQGYLRARGAAGTDRRSRSSEIA